MRGGILTHVILANLVALITLAFLYPELMISPGHLSEGHRELERDCFACHTPLLGPSAGRCIECHEIEKIGLFTTEGEAIKGTGGLKLSFHQELLENDCTACHGDHRGAEGTRSPRRFSHALLQEAAREQCASCHRAPEDALHRKIDGQCAQCHTNTRWSPADFDHDRHFRFDRHHDTDCVTCHEGGDFSRYTCYGCHEHSPAKIREEHREEGIRDYENCVECHRSGDEDEAKRRWRSRGDGLLRGFGGRHEEDDEDDDDD